MTFKEKLAETKGRLTSFRLAGGHIARGVPVEFGDDFVLVMPPSDPASTRALVDDGCVVRTEDIVDFEIDAGRR